MIRVRRLDAHLAFSDRARKAVQLANQEAHRLGHAALGFEHLLLGLVKEGQSEASAVLDTVGFDLAWLRGQVERLRPSASDAGVLPGALPYSVGLESFLEDVVEAGNACGVLPLTPEYLLAALINSSDPMVRQLLRQRRFSLWRLRWTLRRLG